MLPVWPMSPERGLTQMGQDDNRLSRGRGAQSAGCSLLGQSLSGLSLRGQCFRRSFPKAGQKDAGLEGLGTWRRRPVQALPSELGLTRSSLFCKMEVWTPPSVPEGLPRWPWRLRRVRAWLEAGRSLPVSAEYFAPWSLRRGSSFCWNKFDQGL